MPYYLKYGDKVKGDVDDPPPYRGWIELQSLQYGVTRGSNPLIGGSSDRETSSSKLSEIVVTKNTDGASMQLWRESLYGEGVTAYADFVKEGTAYLRITMSGTQISGFQVSGSGTNPTESLTLNFTSIQYKTNPGPPPP